jgi:hypothetical protein
MNPTKFDSQTPPSQRQHRRAARLGGSVADFDMAARVVRFACRKFAVTSEQLEKYGTTRSVRFAQSVAAWLVRRYTSYDLKTIGILFNFRARTIAAWLAKLEEDVQASCALGREMVALDCAFRAFEDGLGGDDKPF